MKTQTLLRQIHHWGSLLIMIQMGVVIIAGLFLMLKKEVEWIQPSTVNGVDRMGAPTLAISDLFETAKSVPELDIDIWTDLARVDIKPGKGVAKFVSNNNWETQIDTTTGEVLQTAFRRSDIIEKLHDGSFFADWVKLYVFLPSGAALLILWATGIYLFFLPHLKRAQRSKRRARAQV
ncbi:MAG: PepSY domain-containing protein [Pseudomonadota bacterium]